MILLETSLLVQIAELKWLDGGEEEEVKTSLLMVPNLKV